jgi:chorismate mutase
MAIYRYIDEAMAAEVRPMSDERLVALRGATTVDADTAEAVMGRTGELLSALLERNGVEHDQVHCYSTLPRASLRHVYLHRAKHLRDDLPE